MPHKRGLIVKPGESTKPVTAPVIVLPSGVEKVHGDADTVGAHDIGAGVRKIVQKTGECFVEDGLDQEKDVKDISDTIVSGQVEQNPNREEAVQNVTKEVIDGEVEPSPARQVGTHTLNGNHILGNGDRVEDNPSKETATKSVTDEIISGEVESIPNREEAVQSVTEQVISGEVEPSPSKQAGTHTVTDLIVEGRVENNPTREEALKSVTDHAISGGIDPTATDNGALESPALPVKVTSGKLGPTAAYSAENWGGDVIWTNALGGSGSVYNNWDGEGEQAGDHVVASCLYNETDRYTTPTFTSETNLNRLFYSYVTNGSGHNFGNFFALWELTAAFAGYKDLEIDLGPSAKHTFVVAVIRNFSEFQ